MAPFLHAFGERHKAQKTVKVEAIKAVRDFDARVSQIDPKAVETLESTLGGEHTRASTHNNNESTEHSLLLACLNQYDATWLKIGTSKDEWKACVCCRDSLQS